MTASTSYCSPQALTEPRDTAATSQSAKPASRIAHHATLHLAYDVCVRQLAVLPLSLQLILEMRSGVLHNLPYYGPYSSMLALG